MYATSSGPGGLSTSGATYYWYSNPALNQANTYTYPPDTDTINPDSLNADGLSHAFVVSASDEEEFLSYNKASSTPYSSLSITPGGTIYNWEDDYGAVNVSGQYFNDVIIESTATTPNALIITANNATKVYGAAVPSPLTANYSYGSSFNVATGPSDMTTGPTVTTTATSASSVGTYLITASGAVDLNYTIFYVPGTLTVTPTGTPTVTPASFTAFGLFDTNYKVNKIIYETLSPYQLSYNSYEPLVFFYHPLTPIDGSAFDGIALDEGAYDFIQNSLELKKLPPAYYGAQ
jgi:hypothetical protein